MQQVELLLSRERFLHFAFYVGIAVEYASKTFTWLEFLRANTKRSAFTAGLTGWTVDHILRATKPGMGEVIIEMRA